MSIIKEISVPDGPELTALKANPRPITTDVFAHARLIPGKPFIWVDDPTKSVWFGLAMGLLVTLCLYGAASLLVPPAATTIGIVTGLAALVWSILPRKLPVSFHTYALMVAAAVLGLREHSSLGGFQIRAGDRVCLVGPNSLELVVLNRALQALGAVCTLIHYNSNSDEVAKIINMIEPRLILCADQAVFDAKIDRTKVLKGWQRFALFDAIFKNQRHPAPDYVAAERRGVAMVNEAVQAEFDRLTAEFVDLWDASAAKPVDLAKPCLIVTTSGSSSGEPKGAMHNPWSLAAACAMVKDAGFDFGPSDLVLIVLPLTHIFALSNSGFEFCEKYAVPCAIVHAKSGLRFLRALMMFRPTILAGVPAAWDLILNGLRKVPGMPWALKQAVENPLSVPRRARALLTVVKNAAGMGRLRFGISGGGAQSLLVVKCFAALGFKIVPGWGMSEVCAAIVNRVDDCDPTTVGSPMPGLSLQLRDVPPEYGMPATAGALWVRGPNVFLGYWGNAQKNAELFDGAWFSTEDVLELGADGKLRVVGKLSDSKKFHNGQFYPGKKIADKLKELEVELGFGPLFEPFVVGETHRYMTLLLRVDLTAAAEFCGDRSPRETRQYAQDPRLIKAKEQLLDALNHWVLSELKNKMFVVGGAYIMPDQPNLKDGTMGPTGKPSLYGMIKFYAAAIALMYPFEQSE